MCFGRDIRMRPCEFGKYPTTCCDWVYSHPESGDCSGWVIIKYLSFIVCRERRKKKSKNQLNLCFFIFHLSNYLGRSLKEVRQIIFISIYSNQKIVKTQKKTKMSNKIRRSLKKLDILSFKVSPFYCF